MERKFKDFISEGKLELIYHGDNYATKKLIPKLMLQDSSNAQEGVGIYFSNLIKTAENYGKDIISIEVDTKKLVPSRGYTEDYITKTKIIKLLKEIKKGMDRNDPEEFYYFITDYVEVYEPEDVDDSHLAELARMLGNDQVRNFQITLAELAGVEDFVDVWNKIIKIDGTYDKVSSEETWYAIINPKYKVNKVK